MPVLPRIRTSVVAPAPPKCTVDNLKTVCAGMCTLDYPIRDLEAKVVEILPGLFMGEGPLNPDRLKKRGIVRVLNVSDRKEILVTNHLENPYKDHGIKYMGLNVQDTVTQDVSQDFEPVAKYLERGLKNGAVYVFSIHGTSRAAVFISAFLMLRKGMPGCEALRAIQIRRPVSPNVGFLQQIVDLDNKLRGAEQRMCKHLEMNVGCECVAPRPVYAPSVHYRDPATYHFSVYCMNRCKVAKKMYYDRAISGKEALVDNKKLLNFIFLEKIAMTG